MDDPSLGRERPGASVGDLEAQDEAVNGSAIELELESGEGYRLNAITIESSRAESGGSDGTPPSLSAAHSAAAAKCQRRSDGARGDGRESGCQSAAVEPRQLHNHPALDAHGLARHSPPRVLRDTQMDLGAASATLAQHSSAKIDHGVCLLLNLKSPANEAGPSSRRDTARIR
eukprot:337727-Rhodomonas_salina.1